MISWNSNSVTMYCGTCDRESQISWLSFFDKVIPTHRKPNHCPWCGQRVSEERQTVTPQDGQQAEKGSEVPEHKTKVYLEK